MRAVVALVGAAAVLRGAAVARRWPAHGGFVVGTLGLTGALAVWCFLNLGAPQFYDAGEGRGTWLHHYDMRTYYPIAKFFPELRFDGVYAASVLAVADGRNLDGFDAQPLRDLRTHVLTTCATRRRTCWKSAPGSRPSGGRCSWKTWPTSGARWATAGSWGR